MSTSDKLSSRKQSRSRSIGVDHPVLPGGLSEQDHERIQALANRKFSPSRIAKAISKRPTTVYWYMVTSGLRAPKQTTRPIQYQRGKVIVRRFSIEEDALLVALRIEGHPPKEIARRLTERFGFERRPHSVDCRLRMLASIDDEKLQVAHEHFR